MVRGNVGWRAALSGVVVVAFLAGCATSKYDQKLEASASEWQEEIRAFIADTEAKAGTPGGEYEANKAFYEGMKNKIGGEVARTQSTSGSARAIEILELIAKNIENLRQLHEQGGKSGLTRAVAQPARELIDAQLRALGTLEANYKSGKETE